MKEEKTVRKLKWKKHVSQTDSR